VDAFLTLKVLWLDERKWQTPPTQGTVQALGGHRSDKITLSPLFSLLKLGPTADVLGETPIAVPGLMQPADALALARGSRGL